MEAAFDALSITNGLATPVKNACRNMAIAKIQALCERAMAKKPTPMANIQISYTVDLRKFKTGLKMNPAMATATIPNEITSQVNPLL